MSKEKEAGEMDLVSMVRNADLERMQAFVDKISLLFQKKKFRLTENK